jgi:hypothetical protein
MAGIVKQIFCHVKYLLYFCSKIEVKMIATRTSLNPIQIHLLEMFRNCPTDSMMDELKKVLSDFYAQKVQREADRLWDEGTLDESAIERILDEHWRTPYPESR